MKTSTAQKIKIGIFTLTGICLLVAGVFIIGSRKNMLGNTFNVFGTFKNIGGLTVGNNVRFAGINIGTVESISIVNDSTVRVNMRLQSKIKPFLKDDAIAAISSDGLMGDKLVTIAPGEGGTRQLADGEQLHTVNPYEFDKIIGRISNVVENAEVVTASLASISSHISAGKGSLGKLIYTDTLERNLVGTVKAAKATMESAKKGTEGFSENMEALKHNVLLKGYYKKKAKEKARKEQENTEAQPADKK